MAELLIKIDDGANYADGDCICAFSDHRIGCTQAEMICRPRPSDRNASGLLLLSSLSSLWMRSVMQYRFERISPTQIRQIDQHTDTATIFGRESIDVRLFVRRRKRTQKHMLFGEDGAEVWFGGRMNLSRPTINRVWQGIELRTQHRKTSDRFRFWPMGRMDIRSHLAVRVDDLTDKEVEDFTEPQYTVDDNGDFIWELSDDAVIVDTKSTPAIDTPPDERTGWQVAIAKKRRRNIRWADLLADINEQPEKVRDKNHPVGHEINENGVMRYTSKTQPDQRKTRVEKKQPQTRRVTR